MVKTKNWSCNNQCKSNCCDYMYLEIDDVQEKSIKESRSFRVGPSYTDFRWLKLHDGIFVSPIKDFERVITLRDDISFKIYVHPISNKKYVYIKSKCTQLLDNNRCKIYQRRPNVCKKGVCIVYDKRKEIQWFGRHIVERVKSNEKKDKFMVA